MSNWFFRPKQPGEKNREPIYGEFFATDAISEPGMALVREGIQNSLDQRVGNDPVIVRIFLSGKDKSLDYDDIKPFFDKVWGHYHAEGSGLHPNTVPKESDPCNYIVFEDFSTTGLEGDPAVAFKPREGGKNNFYHFFRAEGQTDKENIELGSWGVGKHVFYRSSRVSTVFGLSVRYSDKKRFLMGNAILKSHWAENEYCQDGYFGIPPSSEQQLVMPITDEQYLDKFSEIFDLQRGKKDPGLSLVIPWPDNEIDESAIIRAVLGDYFYPILNGDLEVFVETPNFNLLLDDSTLLGEIKKLDKDIAKDLMPLVRLAEWARNVQDEQRVLIKKPDPREAWKWSKSLVDDESLETLKEEYYNGNKIAVRVPVTVRKMEGTKYDSFFDVYLVRDNSDQTGRPTFIREGIIIPKVDAPRTRGVRAIVIAHHGPITKFLRKAENPSHTEWQHTHLKDEYKRGAKTDLEFVKKSVNEIVKLISESEEEEDPTLLVDFFSIPKDMVEEEPEVGEGESDDGDQDDPESPNPKPDPSSRPRKFNIEKIRGGFSILPSRNGNTPEYLDVRVAYDTRRGHPLKRYNKSDFEVDKSPISFDPAPHNVELLDSSENRILLKILKDDFAFHVTGFDAKRQLYIKANPSGGNVNGGS